MKKEEVMKNLDDEGFSGYEDLSWSELQKFYKEKMEIVEERNKPIVSKPTEDSVEEHLEKKIELKPDLRTELEKTRERIFPEIVDLMNRLKGRSRATQDELREMFNLYNTFYQRNDSPSCGTCIARVHETFKKICRGRI